MHVLRGARHNKYKFCPMHRRAYDCIERHAKKGWREGEEAPPQLAAFE